MQKLFFIGVMVLGLGSWAEEAPIDVLTCFSWLGDNRVDLDIYEGREHRVSYLRVDNKVIDVPEMKCGSNIEANGRFEIEEHKCLPSSEADLLVHVSYSISLRYFDSIHVDATVDGLTHSIPHCFLDSEWKGQPEGPIR